MDSEDSAFKIPRAAKNIGLIVLIMLVSDIIVAYLGGAYLSGVFLLFRRGATGIFSDLLFLEGIIALAVGLINIGGISESQGINPGHVGATSDPARRDPEARKRLRKEQLHSGTLLIVLGPVLIGFSMLIPLLLP
jgi:hypothetical protein